MTREEAIEKIKKCLALSKSSNEHEASLALRMAQKMMAEHAVSEDDVSAQAISKDGVQSTFSYTKMKVFESAASRIIQRAFGVRTVLRAGSSKTRALLNLEFYGRGAAPKVASFAYVVLVRACADARTKYVKSRKESAPWTPGAELTALGDAYALGWLKSAEDGVQTLADKYTLSTEELMKHLQLSGRGLVATKARGSNRSYDQGAYSKGQEAGKSFTLSQPVGAGRRVERLG